MHEVQDRALFEFDENDTRIVWWQRNIGEKVQNELLIFHLPNYKKFAHNHLRTDDGRNSQMIFVFTLPCIDIHLVD